jgi:hypothetical protein
VDIQLLLSVHDCRAEFERLLARPPGLPSDSNLPCCARITAGTTYSSIQEAERLAVDDGNDGITLVEACSECAYVDHDFLRTGYLHI